MNKKLHVLIISLLVCYGSFCQEKTSKIKVYTPTGELNADKTTKNDNSYKWAVKTDFLNYIVGEFPISAEMRVGKKLSLEMGVGATYTFMENSGVLFEEDDTESEYSTKPAIGGSFRGTLKYYPSSDYDAIEGWFFGIQAFTKNNNRKYEANTGDSNVDAVLEGELDKRNKTGISLIFGSQAFYDSNVLFEYYFGAGFANVKREYIINDDYTYEPVKKTTNDVVPNILFGVKIGFGN